MNTTYFTQRHIAMKRLLISMQLLGLLAFAQDAGAQAVSCVSNNAQLAIALTQAQFVPVTVKLVQGNYNLHSSPWSGFADPVVQGGTQLLGGYTASCAGRDIAAGNTILDDSAGNDSLIIHGNLTLEGMTIRTYLLILANNIGDGDFGPIPGNIDLPPDTQVLIRRDEFSGNGSVRVDWEQDDDVGGTIRVVDTLIVGNNGVCSVELDNELGGTPTLEMINDTLVNNTSGYGVCIYDHFDGHSDHGNPSLFAYNSIFYGNQVDVFDENSAVFLVDNVIGTHNYPGSIINAGTLTGDPKLNGNYRPIESPPSPVINSGTDNVRGGLPAHDLDGGARVTGTTVDRGAYESGINDAFLQTVTNINDSGTGSLRAAINSANANGSGGALIKFDIGTACGPHVITLNSALPAINAPTIINGYTQTGASENSLDVGDDATLCVILEAGNNNIATGLQVASNAADSVTASIRGLAFSGFSDAAVDLGAGSQHFVGGSHFGGNVGGHALQPNGVDIRLGIATHDVLIGSDDVADRNIIGDASGDGIQLLGGASGPILLGTHDNQVLNNYIGVGWAASGGGYTNRANAADGIHILGHDNTISGNLVGHNLADGIDLDGLGAVNNVLSANFIGTDADRLVLGNGSMGVRVEASATGNTINDNTIANNAQKGVRVVSGVHNKIRRNTIYNNALLGIDLAGEGATPNDDDGAIMPPGYANRGQNFPVVTSAAGGFESGWVSGTLTSTPGSYIVDFYEQLNCDPSGYGEGQVWLRSANITVPSVQGIDQGTATFNLRIATNLPGALRNGVAITTTATDASGDTSEFSACANYLNDTIFADGFQAPPS